MNLIKSLYINLWVTVAAVCVGASGCVGDDSLCVEDRPGYREGDDIWLDFTMENLGPVGNRSRAGDPAGHPEEESSAAENYIDCANKDLSLMFFDDRQLLWRVFGPEEFIVEPVNSDGSDSYASYRVRFKLNKGYFAYADGKDNIDCSFMVVANMRGLKSGNGTFSNNDLFARTPAYIAGLYTSFGMPDQAAGAWMPSIDDGNLIPMAGIAGCSISRIDLDNSTADNAASLGRIDMQRALAKVRILDATGDNPEADIKRIKSVTLAGVNSRGAFMPVGTDMWFNGTTVVETATEMPEWYDASRSVSMLNAPQTSVVTDRLYPNAFYCYVPETTVTGERGMRFIIVAEMKDGQDKEYVINLAEPQGTIAGTVYAGIGNIARNHIYEFEVTASSPVNLALNLHVMDWQSSTTTWNFEDNPGIADGGYIRWTDDSYSGLIKDDALLILTQATTAEAHFTLASPIGGTWTAMLVPEGQTEQDAFMFVNDDGTLADGAATGVIDGKDATLRIRPVYEPLESTNRRARLLISVRTPDGRTLTADMLQDNYGHGNKYFIIQQNAKL